MASGYRLASGWRSEAEVDASYDVESFPVQTDMDTGRVWMRPGNEADVLLPVAEFVDSVDHMRGGYGGVSFVWKMRNLSPKMVAHLFNNIFYGAFATRATARTFNRATGAFETYQVIAQWPNVQTAATPAGGGYDELAITFVEGYKAALGPDMSVDISHSGTPTKGSNTTFTITSTNGGDAATFGNLQVDVSIDPNLDFVSTTATNWTITYSTDGSSYSTTIPSPASNTVAVRYVYTSAVAVSGSPNNITLVGNPAERGTQSVLVILATAGDTDLSDNSDTDTYEVNLVRDNQTAYLKARDLTSDNQNVYLKGRNSSSDNQAAYLVGV